MTPSPLESESLTALYGLCETPAVNVKVLQSIINSETSYKGDYFEDQG